MRKLIFLNRYFSPDESATSQLLSDLAFDLAAAGYRVEIVTSRQRYEDASADLPPRGSDHGVAIYRIWTSRWGRGRLAGRAIDYLTFYISAATWLAFHAHRGDVIIAKTDPPLIGVVAAAIARLKGATLINWLQDLYPEVAEQLKVGGVSATSGILHRLRNWGLRAARVNVVIGRCMADLLERFEIPPGRIAVIPNWVDDVAIRPLPREAHALRHEWGLDGMFVVGYSGNMGRVHEFERLLAAVTLMVSQASIRFLFVGAGAKKNDLRDVAEQNDLGNVLFKPFQPQSRLGQSLTVPDVHVVTLQDSLEGLIVPSKFYGALAAGRPVIFVGPPGCEVARVIRERQCGYVFDGHDPAVLAVLIRDLASSPEQVRILGEKARRATETSYGRSHALAAWRKVIEAEASAPESVSPAATASGDPEIPSG